ncbi:MAG: glycosyltransferase family 4 protein [Chloroflexota bacterium]
MTNVLLTVSGVIDPDIKRQVAQQMRPKADYLEMAQCFDAELMDYTSARERAGWFGNLLERVGGPNFLLAWTCFRERSRYSVIFTDGEQIGLPLAWLLKFGGRKGIAHLMIVHILSVGKKMMLLDVFGLKKYIDTFFVYSTWQKRFIEERWQVQSEQVVFTPFMVDSDFFSPAQVKPQQRRMICAVGLEFRDYPTLIEAVRDLDVEVVIAAASPWSKREDSTEYVEIPENVTVQKFSQFELRQLYADSLFVVMPLYEVNFQAGVTALLEAMAMERAIICSRTSGQTDVVVAGETGLYVPPEDPYALREAIVRLLASPELAEKMGRAGRCRIEEEMSLERYVERLNQFVRGLK